jgi:glycosyltransferase involved in cell wall biosynthesis
MLRAAERVSSAVLTVDGRTFPIPSRKVRSIGHGIDVSEFPCRMPTPHGGIRAIALGRYSPAKGYDTILRGVRLAVDGGLDISLEMHGPVLSGLEAAHRTRVKEAILELGLEERVLVNGSIPRSAVPTLFSGYDLLVNNMRKGSPDKVVFEAGASCLPVLASNPAFDGFLDEGYRFPRNDAGALADRLGEFAALDETRRTDIGRELRRRVVEGHSVEHWAEQVLAAAGKR